MESRSVSSDFMNPKRVNKIYENNSDYSAAYIPL